MKDSFGREIDYLRISVTDRCNLRCIYCMPRDCEAGNGAPEELLSPDEIVMITGAAAKTGIQHVKLTGGEPLLREDICRLVSRIRNTDGIETVSMTTNGILLGKYSAELAAAGLDSINVSLDTLNEERFAQITGIWGISEETEGRAVNGTKYEGGTGNGPEHAGPDPFSVKNILAGIDKALSDGLKVRVNCVLTGINRDEWADLSLLARDRRLDVRFIELMPIGNGRRLKTASRVSEAGGAAEVTGVSRPAGITEATGITGVTGVTNRELAALMAERFGALEPVREKKGNGPAVYYRLPGFEGCIGFISPICDKFCHSCNRIRLTAAGILKPCLCYASQTDLRRMIENGAGPEMIEDTIREAIRNKPAAHCFENPDMISETGSMSQIGG